MIETKFNSGRDIPDPGSPSAQIYAIALPDDRCRPVARGRNFVGHHAAKLRVSREGGDVINLISLQVQLAKPLEASQRTDVADLVVAGAERLSEASVATGLTSLIWLKLRESVRSSSRSASALISRMRL